MTPTSVSIVDAGWLGLFLEGCGPIALSDPGYVWDMHDSQERM